MRQIRLVVSSALIMAVTLLAVGCTKTETTAPTPATVTQQPVNLALTMNGPMELMHSTDLGGSTSCTSLPPYSSTNYCNRLYNPGTTVTLSVRPGSGKSFVGWSGNCTGSGSCSFIITVPTTVAATVQ